MIKVLLYNWVPLDCPKGSGGGVAVYIENLLNAFVRGVKKDIHPTYLSSGYYYDGVPVPKIRREADFNGIPVYSIVNSPVLAPSGFPLQMFKELLRDKSLKDVFCRFVEETGPYDVIHFNSLEGLTPQVLSLKEKFPHTRFVHTLHDYGVFCPKVQFWAKNNINCVLNPHLSKCTLCMKPYQDVPASFTKRLRPSTYGDKRKHIVLRLCCRFLGKTKVYSLFCADDENVYKKYRDVHVDCINKYIDTELVVSRRVGEIAMMYGITPEIIKVSYIGTKVADMALGHNRNDENKAIFTMLYMGYMSKMKGFYFYLSVLDKIDEKIASMIDLKFATKITDRLAYEHAMSLKGKFHDVVFFDGYTHEDFPKILVDVNLGIVPPLWEDNLPQVAMEMIANGIPVLASCHGGAKELNGHPDFVFTDERDCMEKIRKITCNRDLLIDYWSHYRALTTMEKHIEQLVSVYMGE